MPSLQGGAGGAGGEGGKAASQCGFLKEVVATCISQLHFPAASSRGDNTTFVMYVSLFQVEIEEREGKTDGTVAIQRMQEELMRKHGHPVEMVEVLRTARMWYPGVQQFWDLPIQVRKALLLPPGSLVFNR